MEVLSHKSLSSIHIQWYLDICQYMLISYMSIKKESLLARWSSMCMSICIASWKCVYQCVCQYVWPVCMSMCMCYCVYMHVYLRLGKYIYRWLSIASQSYPLFQFRRLINADQTKTVLNPFYQTCLSIAWITQCLACETLKLMYNV